MGRGHPIDTRVWALKEKVKEREKAQEVKAAAEPLEVKEQAEVFDKEYVFKEGEIIVFEQEPTKDYPIPFGVGTVLKHSKGEDVRFQWRGNRNNNEKGKWDLCWYQQNERKIYYAGAPLHASHERNTGEATDTIIKVGDIVMSSRGGVEILYMDKANKASYMTITAKARKIIEANPYVEQGRKELEQAKNIEESNSEVQRKQPAKKRQRRGV